MPGSENQAFSRCLQSIECDFCKSCKFTLDKSHYISVTFTSDDKSIATVNSKGLVKGIKAGKTSIRIKIGDKSYVCEVTVK